MRSSDLAARAAHATRDAARARGPPPRTSTETLVASRALLLYLFSPGAPSPDSRSIPNARDLRAVRDGLAGGKPRRVARHLPVCRSDREERYALRLISSRRGGGVRRRVRALVALLVGGWGFVVVEALRVAALARVRVGALHGMITHCRSYSNSKTATRDPIKRMTSAAPSVFPARFFLLSSSGFFAGIVGFCPGVHPSFLHSLRHCVMHTPVSSGE